MKESKSNNIKIFSPEELSKMKLSKPPKNSFVNLSLGRHLHLPKLKKGWVKNELEKIF